MSRRTTAYLELADWRRRISALYAAVRTLAADDPTCAWQHWCRTRETMFREHPQSPLPLERRASFTAHHFPYDPALRVAVTVDLDVRSDDEAADGGEVRGDGHREQEGIPLSGTADGSIALQRVGTVVVPFVAGERRLELYWMGGYGDGLFLSFRDLTNGIDTYGGGRYLLDAAKSADLGLAGHGDGVGLDDLHRLTLDFNFAYHPSCAWDPQWVCPLVARENYLDIMVQGGEQLS